MAKPKILLQFDTDKYPSSFDSVVAIDSGVDQLLTYSGMDVDQVESLVHGAMFTRGGDDLKNTALFFGGSNVERTEVLVEEAQSCFFGDVRVSIMSDPNGSNTTAVASVLCAEKHLELAGKQVVVLAGTGPVGLRIAHLALRQGANVKLCSRRLERAENAVEFLFESTAAEGDVQPGVAMACETADSSAALELVAGSDALFAAGAAGIQLLDEGWEAIENGPSVVVDINAVPPTGIAGVQVFDKGKEFGNSICYGAIGVGGRKMKIHRECVKQLFTRNDLVLDTESIYEIGKSI